LSRSSPAAPAPSPESGSNELSSYFADTTLVVLCYEIQSNLEHGSNGFRGVEVGVVRAKIQTVEDLYQLVRTAVVGRQAMEAATTATIDYSVHTAWVETKTGSSVCFVINMADKAGADYSRPAQQQTGAALWWRSSASWSCSQIAGIQRPIIPARKPAL
jgi:hypothetical protein